MLQGSGARLCTIVVLGGIAPGASHSYGTIAIGWELVVIFAIFKKLGLSFRAHFSTFEVAGHVVVITEVFLKSLFTHKQLLHSLSLVFICRLGHVVENSFTVHGVLFVFPPLMMTAFSWLGRRLSKIPCATTGICPVSAAVRKKL